tara:strand:- start:116920 stop:117840 length:921 start_codon:yes stop_codon:yes gene_type:complete
VQGYALSADGFLSREFQSPELLGEDVRVRVEYACLETDSALDDVCPGGGLVGVVVECGEAATAFQDARVLVPQVSACGECDTCRRGAATVCPSRRVLGRDQHGGCAETVVCSGRWLTRVDELITLEGPMAALAAGPALRAYALFCKAGVAAGEVVIVLGTGATAEILALLATSRGAKLARGVGETSAEAIAKQLSEQGCTDRPQKLFVVEGESNLELAIQIAHPSSVITTAIGVGNLDLQTLFDRELSLLSLSYGHPDLLPETAALIVKGELDLGAILSEAVLGPESFEQSRQAQSDGKCLVVHRA